MRIMPIPSLVSAAIQRAKSNRAFVLVLACSLTLSACASPVAPAALPANFYEAVRSDVEGFWADFFPSKLGRKYTPINAMQLFAEQPVGTRCSGSPAFYCYPDQGVYLQTEFMQKQMSTFGKFGPAMIIGHEVGHHVQNVLGIPDTFTILRELQADCLAGSWLGSASARGLLDVGDYQEAADNFFVLGDPIGTPWFAPNAHGTVQQRQQFFQNGFLNGALSC